MHAEPVLLAWLLDSDPALRWQLAITPLRAQRGAAGGQWSTYGGVDGSGGCLMTASPWRVLSLSLGIVALGTFAATAQDRFRATGGELVITPVIHASVQIEHGGRVIHVDPWSHADLSRLKPADLIVVTDDVAHHLDAAAIKTLRKPGAPVVIAANGRGVVPDGIVLANGETREVAGVTIEAIAAYDLTPGESFHPKGEANGYILTVGGKRIYIAGVTECVPEVQAVRNIDIAFIAINVPAARMEPAAAIACLSAIAPRVVYPYHYDQDWVLRLARDGTRQPPTTRGLQALVEGLSTRGIDVRLATWYPPRD